MFVVGKVCRGMESAVGMEVCGGDGCVWWGWVSVVRIDIKLILNSTADGTGDGETGLWFQRQPSQC